MNLALIIIIVIAVILAIFGGLNSALSWLLWVALIVGVIALIVFLFRVISGNRRTVDNRVDGPPRLPTLPPGARMPRPHLAAASVCLRRIGSVAAAMQPDRRRAGERRRRRRVELVSTASPVVERERLGAEVRDDLPPARAAEPQHVVAAGVDPLELLGRLQLVPQGERPPVERQHRVGIVAPAPRRRARRTTPAAAGARRPSPKPNESPVRVHGSGTRHPSRPTSTPGLRKNVGSWRSASSSLGDLVQAELLALVEVGRPGQPEHEERRRARAARARARGRAPGCVPPREQPLVAVLARRTARRRRAPGAAGRSASRAARRRGSTAPTSSTSRTRAASSRLSVTMCRNCAASKSASSRSKLNAWPRPSALA